MSVPTETAPSVSGRWLLLAWLVLEVACCVGLIAVGVATLGRASVAYGTAASYRDCRGITVSLDLPEDACRPSEVRARTAQIEEDNVRVAARLLTLQVERVTLDRKISDLRTAPPRPVERAPARTKRRR
jgi:hypothetical protein